jgi:hypothetical protein
MIKHLIVEAESDKLFIQTFLRHENLNLQLNIDVATPQDLEPTAYTTKQAVLQQLPRLVKLLETGQVSHIGILVDMDFTDKTDIKTQNLRQISERLNPLGFYQPLSYPQNTLQSRQFTVKSVNYLFDIPFFFIAKVDHL